MSVAAVKVRYQNGGTAAAQYQQRVRNSAKYIEPAAPTDSRHYPTAPLTERLERQYGGLHALGPTIRRNILRSAAGKGLTSRYAEWCAVKLLGVLPEEIWPDFWTSDEQ